MKKLLLIILMILSPALSFAANQTLYVIQPRTSGSGSPAIPSTHRIFYAYPGIEYKIRAAVVGGDYPYVFTLNNEPSGMTVDAQGYIVWPNPQSSATDVGLRVTDSEGAYTDVIWSITVQTSGFRFVDADAVSNGDGTIASPHDSLANMVASAPATDIVYFRAGTYSVPVRGDHTIETASAFEWNDPSATATRWLAYPGDEAIIDLTNNRYFYGATSTTFYFDGLTFKNGREYFFRSNSALNYVTFLDNTFDTLLLERPDYGSNQGTYFTEHNGTGYFFSFQGNKVKGCREAMGIGSFYDQTTFLIENNHFTDISERSAYIGNVLGLKVGLVRLTLRGNFIYLDGDSDFMLTGGASSAYFGDGRPNSHGPNTEEIEILYNYFRHDGGLGIDLNRRGDTQNTGVFWIHHNTFVCPVQMTNLNAPDNCDGPWYFSDNIFQNATSGLSYHYTCSGTYQNCVTLSDNLGATSGIVDTDGLLTESYEEYLGLRGWQFADGSTPMDGSYEPPAPDPGSTTINLTGPSSISRGGASTIGD